MKDNTDTVINTLAILADIYKQDSNALLSMDIDRKHVGNAPALYAEAVAKLLTLLPC